jgi:hypothetical protein
MINVHIYKSKWFTRFARQNKISDKELSKTIEQINKGLIDAQLGKGVYKQRLARPGEGKSAGYRTIIIFQKERHAFFVYGFSKSHVDNIDVKEEEAFREMAKYILALSDKELATLIEKGEFMEVTGNG